jgi:hypothetical protein
MRRRIGSLIISTGLVMGLFGAQSAIAQEAGKQETSKSIVIQRDSKLGGEALARGEYAIKFVEGKEGELVFLKGKREVLKATYKVIQLDEAAAANSVVSTAEADGSYQLKRIEFKGKKGALVFDNTIARSIAKQ